MTRADAVSRLIMTAKNEVGYLEKATNSSLDSKSANAGQNNYTKYWRDIKPQYQGQAWCACFVTWCFVQTFGRDMAERLLRHYPYVYCPAMAGLFTLNSNPKKGDIVIFKRGGTFTHTGIVTSVNGDYFTTVEGNTSGGSTIIANGGGVCSKGYFNSNLPGTKFCTPDWSILEEGNELMSNEYNELKALIASQNESINALKEKNLAQQKDIDRLKVKNGYYNYIDGNMPEYARPTVKKLKDAGLLEGNEKGELMLTTDMMRMLTILDRAGVF